MRVVTYILIKEFSNSSEKILLALDWIESLFL